MLINVRNKFAVIFASLLFGICSCHNNSKDLNQKRKLYFEFSINNSSKISYKRIHKQANDSIKVWVKNSLQKYLSQRLNNWKLDPLICFNKQGDKCVMALLVRETYWKKAVQENIDWFYGSKINSKWYFFKGPALALPRELYQKDQYTPLSFEKMEEIAMDEIFSGYLKKGKNSEWEINEDWFKFHFEGSGWAFTKPNGEYVTYPTPEQIDSLIISSTRELWKHKDTTTYSP